VWDKNRGFARVQKRQFFNIAGKPVNPGVRKGWSSDVGVHHDQTEMSEKQKTVISITN
jgi:hypothetical protein